MTNINVAKEGENRVFLHRIGAAEVEVGAQTREWWLGKISHYPVFFVQYSISSRLMSMSARKK